MASQLRFEAKHHHHFKQKKRTRNSTVACMALNSINVIFPEVEFITHSAFMTKNLVSKKLQTISILFNVTVAAICGEIVAS